MTIISSNKAAHFKAWCNASLHEELRLDIEAVIMTVQAVCPDFNALLLLCSTCTSHNLDTLHQSAVDYL